MIKIWRGKWTYKEVSDGRNEFFVVFGDNDLREGCGGQAVVRGLPNVIGLRTKKAPRRNYEAYYTDAEFEENKRKIDEDIDTIRRMNAHMDVYLSANGYGNGLADLPRRAPKTYSYLCDQLNKLVNELGQ